MSKGKKQFLSMSDRIGAKRWTAFKYFMLVFPFMVFVFAFSYVPLFGWIYSVLDYKQGMGAFDFREMEFVGLRYFKMLITDRNMPRILRNTFAMSICGLLLSPLPIFFSILINDIKSQKAKKFIQTTTTFPNFISWVIVFGLAQAIFSANGMLNQLLKMIGVTPSPFGLIGEPKTIWAFMLSIGQWKGLGWGCIIYLAAIAGIDSELYDAAKVDGANKVQLIWHITIPGVLPTYFVLLVMSISNIMSVGFEQFYLFMNPLTRSKMEVLDYYIYSVGFVNQKYSYGVAAGMVKSLIGIILLVLANLGAKKVRGSSLF